MVTTTYDTVKHAFRAAFEHTKNWNNEWYGMNTNNYSEQELLGLVASGEADRDESCMPRYAPFNAVQRKLGHMSRIILWTNYGHDGSINFLMSQTTIN
jgi:hypothetical protein